jgi:hypothetical protein
MGSFNIFTTNKSSARENNYKLDIFETISRSNDVADMSAIKKYFDRAYEQYSGAQSTLGYFSAGQNLEGLYAAEPTNKIRRLQDYRAMSVFPEIASALDTICYSAESVDELNQLVTLQINDKNLEAKDVEEIRSAAQEYFDLFDFDNNFIEYFRKLLVDGQLCWENIVAKDDLEQGIIDINFIPADAFEFCYDTGLCKKIGIMITNTGAQMYNIVSQNGISNVPPGPINIGGNLSRLNCYEDLQDNNVIVLPFEQLTYVDSGIYSADNKVVYSPLERARRAYNQLLLIEDAILIYRMVRAPEKYVFNVDIGKMPRTKGEQKVAQLQSQFGTKKVYDPATGTIGKTYDPMQMTENFWFVKGADSEGINVSTLTSQHSFGNLDDLEYFLKKLYRSLNIPISRYFEANVDIKTGGAEGNISAEELNFAKFIISLQKRFAVGLLDGLIVHLKFKGLWDLYKLTRSKLDVIFTPPIEYQQYRRQKLLESKLDMIKLVVGEEGIGKLFSEEFALQYFMGWDKDKIKQNSTQRFLEQIQHAKEEAIIEKVKTSGKVDITDEEMGFSESLRDILLKGIADPEPNESSDEEAAGDEFEDAGGDDVDFGDETEEV